MKFLRTFLLATFFFAAVNVGAISAAQDSSAVEMKVKTLLIDRNTRALVVVLESVADKKLLPIWIDVPEARAISMEIEQVKMPRPLTHDLIRNILQGLGATVHRVTISELRNDIYFAIISVGLKGQESEIDARPSDAIAVALRMKAPIYAAAEVLAKAKPLPSQASHAEQTQKRLGIQAQDLTPELAKLMDIQSPHGVLVADVVIGSAAMKADIQRGDLITKLNDRPVHTAADLEATIQVVKSPSRIKFELIKKGKPTMVVIDLP